MKKFVAIFLSCVLLLSLCACNNSSKTATETTESNSETAPEATENNLEVAQQYIADGQYEDAYALLYGIENRSAEEENLFAQFSFILTGEKYIGSSFTKISMYNDTGKLIEETTTWTNGDTTHTVCTYNENNMILSLNRVSSTGGWTLEKYTYDDNDNCILTLVEANTGELAYSFTYDKDGNCLTETRDTGGKLWVIKYSYDAQGRKISESDNYDNHTTYIYNDFGQLVEELGEGSLGAFHTNYTYNDRGLLIQVETQSEYPNSASYTYDEYGNTLTVTSNNIISGSSTTSYAYTYDRFGNMLKKVTSENGKEVSTTEFTYTLVYQPS